MEKTERSSDYKIEPLLLHRWSKRAMSGEEITEKELMTLFEAARWAPSSGNEQPWRFIYARKGTNFWDEFFSLLNKGNQEWCVRASVLVIVFSATQWSDDKSPMRTHSFDTGAAWENLALQAAASDIVVHGMEGFNYDEARKLLHLDASYNIEMMIAIGKAGDKNLLSHRNQAREEAKGRRKLSEIVFEGRITF